MLTIANNPPRYVKNLNNNRKKVYTINNRSKNLFTIRLNDKNNIELSAVLSFAKEIDALKVAHMLEVHYLIAKEWPNSLVDINSSIFLLSNQFKEYNELDHLSINSWNFNDFNSYCMNNLVDYLYINKFYKNKDNNYNIKGQLIKIVETDIACARILNNIYNKS
jgi:hypothetical protein